MMSARVPLALTLGIIWEAPDPSDDATCWRAELSQSVKGAAVLLKYTLVRPGLPAPSVQATLQIFASQAIDGAATGVTAKPPAVTVTGGSMLPSTTSGSAQTRLNVPLTVHTLSITSC